MAPSIPTTEPTEPTEAIAGDTWRWTKRASDYPASQGWALTYAFRGAGALDVVAVASGDAYDVTVPATQSAPLPAGTYVWIARATKGQETYTVDRGTTTVRPDLAQMTAGQAQSHEERCIPLLEAAIEKRCTVDMKAYALTETSATREELKEMRALLNQYRAHVQARQLGGPPPTVIRFGRSGRTESAGGWG